MLHLDDIRTRGAALRNIIGGLHSSFLVKADVKMLPRLHSAFARLIGAEELPFWSLPRFLLVFFIMHSRYGMVPLPPNIPTVVITPSVREDPHHWPLVT